MLQARPAFKMIRYWAANGLGMLLHQPERPLAFLGAALRLLAGAACTFWRLRLLADCEWRADAL